MLLSSHLVESFSGRYPRRALHSVRDLDLVLRRSFGKRSDLVLGQNALVLEQRLSTKITRETEKHAKYSTTSDGQFTESDFTIIQQSLSACITKNTKKYLHLI